MEQTLAEWIENEMEYEDGITSYSVCHMWTWHDMFYIDCNIELTDDGEKYYVEVADQRVGDVVERVYTTVYDLESTQWKLFQKYCEIEADILIDEMDEC